MVTDVNGGQFWESRQRQGLGSLVIPRELGDVERLDRRAQRSG